MLAPAPRRPLASSWPLLIGMLAVMLSLLAHRTPPVITSSAPLPPAPITPRSAPPLPLWFTANHDQRDATARFALGGAGGALVLGDSALRISVNAPATAPGLPDRAPSAADAPHTIALSFTGARMVQPVGIDAATTDVAVFRGTPDQWRRNVPVFSAIQYSQLWTGIDLEYRVVDGQVKYAFTVAAGADPRQIELVYHGADDARIAADGALELTTRHGIVRDTAPVSFQVIDGTTRAVASHFVMDRRVDGSVALRFALGAYDAGAPLVIDPAIILSSGFLGGDGTDYITRVEADSSGNIIVVGHRANSRTFPQPLNDIYFSAGSQYIFIAKYSFASNQYEYITYIASHYAGVNDLAIGSDDSIYIVGAVGEGNPNTTWSAPF